MPTACPKQLEAAILAAKHEKPSWGARKIRERLLRRLPHEVKVPACSTIHAILDRHGLVTRARRSRTHAEGPPLSSGMSPNALWCTDYKGEFKLGNQRYCYPLTVTDHASRYLLLCEAMESNQEQFAFTAFERLFRERGLPQAIRSDNGVPLRLPQRALQSVQALGLVAAPGYHHRTHSARSSATERPS
jgi:putative transposase